ncbi:putative Uncharacterized MFS-type transporter C18.02 [Glarea lozoyensis 74030]|uniref:Putative Uncharacterized MFS-type transporter C18.02 n=1 Tax=Glarea lozoyensis (strain ATCC 74030 / MF5533) TaxID=1104152 RepID=H0EN55_GLAL7|nr:putative Uncharacterized MFS-type transporter C18.02 [Glarea lozoyensis 74030]
MAAGHNAPCITSAIDCSMGMCSTGITYDSLRQCITVVCGTSFRVTHNTLGQKVLFSALLLFIGVGLALVLPPLMAEITYVVEAKEREQPGRFGATGAYAQAYGLFIAAFAAGTLIGPVWAGYVEDSAGWGTMTWSLALFSLVGAVPNAKNAEERAAGVQALGERDEEMVVGIWHRRAR